MTPARVRNRIQAAEAEISDDVLNEFIADEEAFVEAYAGKTFSDTDPQIGLTADTGERDRRHECGRRKLLLNYLAQVFYAR
jgi:hypothetical protein